MGVAQDRELTDAKVAKLAGSAERARWIARNVLPHEAELRRLLRRRAPPMFEVDDIVQEIYARLAAIAIVDHIQNPKAYLLRMASGVIMDHLRHQKVVPIHAVEDLDLAGGVCSAPSPEAVAVDRDELRRLLRVLASLPPGVAEVFRLRRIEGLSQREVSRQLRIPESTIEKRMARGIYLVARSFESGGIGPAEPTKLLSRKLSRERKSRER